MVVAQHRAGARPDGPPSRTGRTGGRPPRAHGRRGAQRLVPAAAVVLVLVLSVGSAATAALVAQRALAAVCAPGPAAADDVVVLAAAAALAVTALWWAAAWALACAGSAAHRLGHPSRVLDALAARLAPALVRRAAAACLGVGLLGGVAAPALASPVAAPPAATSPVATSPVVAPASSATPATASPAATTPVVVPAWPAQGEAWTPSAPVSVPARVTTPVVPAAPQRPAATADGGGIVVHRGDTLWSIAARSLPAGSSAADVAREWPRWWRSNHAVVGDDPDHLLPGQVLHAPTSSPAASGTGAAR